ncbi:MAG: SymE family type I addiction module toxin [Marvinbryantia sp.]
MKTGRNLTVYGFKGRRDDYPAEIRIKGQWLKDCGFDVGVRYHVECSDGKLILTVLTEDRA